MEDKKTHHPTVELLLRRMETHPEEFREDVGGMFTTTANRWTRTLSHIQESGLEEDWLPLKKKLRDIRMEAVHEYVMDELCNGEERRIEARKLQEDYARKVQLAAMQNNPPPPSGYYPLALNNQISNLQNYNNALTNATPASKLNELTKSLFGKS
jgi:hypothetical protein